ncbi:MAG TPA: leucine--tRNA ligase, partial [Verrucomicrobiae bacterium]|nr:leucine--tRNA ligase [Verrucomicrobiae bacterium]
QLGHSSSVHRGTWPKYSEEYLAEDTVTVAVQVNGKLRGTIQVLTGADEATVVEIAKTDPKLTHYLTDTPVRKTIYRPGKLLNFVV